MDTGRELYVEREASSVSSKRSDSIMSGVIMGTGVALLLFSIWLVISMSSGQEVTVIFFGIAAFVVFLGWSRLSSNLRVQGFAVFENGIRSPTASKTFGKKVEFVPFDQMTRVSMEAHPLSDMILYIRLWSKDGKEIDLTYSDLSQPLKVLRILTEKVPTLIDPSVSKVLEFSRKYPEKVARPSDNVGMEIFILAMTGLLLVFFSNAILRSIDMLVVGIPLILVLVVMFSWAVTVMEERSQRDRFLHGSNVSEKGVTLKYTFFGRIFKKRRDFIPVNEFVEVERRLDSGFYAAYSRAKLPDGTCLDLPAGMWDICSKGWKTNIDVATNPKPMPMQGKVSQVNYPYLFIFVFFGTLCAFAIGGLIGTDLGAAWNAYSIYFLAPFLIFGVCVLFFSIYLASKRARLFGMSVKLSEKGITILDPNIIEPPKSFAWSEMLIYEKRQSPTLGEHLYIRTPTQEFILHPKYFDEIKAWREREKGIPAPTLDIVAPSMPVMPGSPVAPGTPVSPSQPTPPPVVEGKGALILADSVEVTADFKAYMISYGWKMTVGGVIGMIAAVLIGLYLRNGFFIGWMVLLIGLLGIVFLVLGVAFLVGAKKAGPSKIYENGIESINVIGKEIFNPWGMIVSYDTTDIRGKKFYQFKNRQGLPVGIISMSAPGIAEAVAKVKPRFNSPDYVLVVQPQDDVKWKRWELIAYAASIPIVFAVSAFATFYMSDSLNNPGTFLAITGLMGMIMLAMMARVITNLKKQKNVKPGLNLKVLVPMMLCMFLISQVWLFGLQTIEVSPELASMRERPFVGVTQNYINYTGVLDKPIIVDAGAMVLIKNSTISYDGADGMRALWVDKGGTVLIEDSTLRGPSKYSIQIDGKARMTNSTFDSIWGDKKRENGIGGIEIYSDDVVFKNCTVSNSTNQGIFTIYSSPVIESSVFRDSGDEGIETHGGAPKVANSTFTNVRWGVITWRGSYATITNNVFHASVHGIYSEYSHLTIKNNKFYDSKNSAIAYDGAMPDMAGNEFYTDTKVIQGQGSVFDMICSVSSVVVLIACIAFVVYLSKRK